MAQKIIARGGGVLVAQLCLTVWDPVDCSLPGSCVHGILQASIPEWVAISSSRGSPRPRDRTLVSPFTGRFFTAWATREAPWTACSGWRSLLCQEASRAGVERSQGLPPAPSGPQGRLVRRSHTVGPAQLNHYWIPNAQKPDLVSGFLKMCVWNKERS